MMTMFPNTTSVIIINDMNEYKVYINNQGVLFEVDANYDIISERQETDCQDHNDVARWLLRTLLAIEKAEAADKNMHCDWSAEPRYTFTPVIEITEEDDD